MPEWWTYTLADAQIFSARSYDRLVERCAREAWPAQPLVVLIALGVLLLLWRRPSHGARALAAAAALACAGTAAYWLPQCYAQLHWMAGAIAAAFAVQALLLAAAALAGGALADAGRPRARAGAAALAAVATGLLPWLLRPEGTSAWRSEWPGLMPVPTLALCLAVLPLARWRWRLPLLPLPLAGSVVEAVTLASIGRPLAASLPLLLAAAALVLVAISGGKTSARA